MASEIWSLDIYLTEYKICDILLGVLAKNLRISTSWIEVGTNSTCTSTKAYNQKYVISKFRLVQCVSVTI